MQIITDLDLSQKKKVKEKAKNDMVYEKEEQWTDNIEGEVQIAAIDRAEWRSSVEALRAMKHQTN